MANVASSAEFATRYSSCSPQHAGTLTEEIAFVSKHDETFNWSHQYFGNLAIGQTIGMIEQMFGSPHEALTEEEFLAISQMGVVSGLKPVRS